MEKKIHNNSYSKEVSKLPKSLMKEYDISIMQQNGRNVWEIKRKGAEPVLTILYLHGGAYYANITKPHWLLIGKIIESMNVRIIVPDYPLAPESNCENIYNFLEALYVKNVNKYSDNRIALMGDSAGGGLALGLAQRIQSRDIKQADEIILFSPWMDVTMSNPHIRELEKDDHILSVTGFREACENYAGSLDLTDSRVSPIYGDCSNLPEVSVFIGTHDVLLADARKCKAILEGHNVKTNYFEYPGMFHDWVIITSLDESVDVLEKVKMILFSN
ncbi:MAG: alpha/beta hydrolase [Marinilabiliales bacterium]|nr:MAG: alpha/beta hydrolase [Marinilabiliales bacterium]